LISAIKFFFPGKLGEYTWEVPTAIAAPLFKGVLAKDDDPIPVWPGRHGISQ